MTMKTKKKRLANTDIEISQHALVTFKFLTEFVAFYVLFNSERCPCNVCDMIVTP